MASSTLDDYDLGQQIGKGGFASVYRARQRTTGKEVAIKVTRKNSITDAAMMERVKNEIIIHRKLKHRNIVAFMGCFEDSLNVYIVLELCGGNLFHYLKDQGPLPESTAVMVIQQLISALEYIHNQGIVHRDLKLSNILLMSGISGHDEQLTIKVCDFGLAVQKQHPDEEHYTLCGTPNYIAPEIAAQRAHGYPADLWSVGCLFYTMVVGAPPFEQGDVKDTLERIISGVYAESDKISEEGRHFLRSLLHLNPMQRANVKELLVHPLLTPSPSPSPSPTKDLIYNRQASTASVSPVNLFKREELASTENTPTNNKVHIYGTKVQMQQGGSSKAEVESKPTDDTRNAKGNPHISGPVVRTPPVPAQWSIQRRSSPHSIQQTQTVNPAEPQSAGQDIYDNSQSQQDEQRALEDQIRDLQQQYQYQRQYLHNHHGLADGGPNGSVTTASTALVSYPSPRYIPYSPRMQALPYPVNPVAQQRVLSSGESARLHSARSHINTTPSPPHQQLAQAAYTTEYDASRAAPVARSMPLHSARADANPRTDAPSQHAVNELSATIRGPTLSHTEPTVTTRPARSPPTNHHHTPPIPAPKESVQPKETHGTQVPTRVAGGAGGARHSLQYQKTIPEHSPLDAAVVVRSLDSERSAGGADAGRSRSVSISFLHGLTEHENTSYSVAGAENANTSHARASGVNISAIGASPALNNTSMRSSRSSRSWLENLSDLRSSLNGSAGSPAHRQSTGQHQSGYNGYNGHSSARGDEMRSWQQQYAYDKFIGSPPSVPHTGAQFGTQGNAESGVSDNHSLGQHQSHHSPTASALAVSTQSPADLHQRIGQDMHLLRPCCLTTSRGELLLLTLEKDLVFVSKASASAGGNSGKQNYIRLVLTSAFPCTAIIGTVNEAMQEETTHIMLDVVKSSENARLSEVADLSMSSNLDDFISYVNGATNRDCEVTGFKFHLNYSGSQLRIASDMQNTRQFHLSNDPAEGSEAGACQQNFSAEVPAVVVSLLRRALTLLISVRSRVPKQIVYFAAPVHTHNATNAVNAVSGAAAPQKGDLNCKCMLMCNEPYPDFYMRWTDGVKLRYELQTGRLHIEKPAGGGGTTSRKPALRWSGVLNMGTGRTANSPGSAHSCEILPELMPYAAIAQRALAKCLQDQHRSSVGKLASSTASHRGAVHATPGNPVPKILTLD